MILQVQPQGIIPTIVHPMGKANWLLCSLATGSQAPYSGTPTVAGYLGKRHTSL